jgi:uncharacterized protein YcbK (DUF882 family)
MDNVLTSNITRRHFLRLGLSAVAAGLTSGTAYGAVGKLLSDERSLSFYNTHTGDSLETIYWAGGKYLPDSLLKINQILRDHRTGDVRPIDPRLLDILYVLNRKISAKNPFHIISGYRSPKTNKMLRKKSKGVASKSLHLVGQAVDIRLPGCSLKKLRNTALELKAGGVGYYSRSNFVHIDTGHIRNWGS